MREIPLLTAQDIECRVQSVSRNRSGKVGAVLLLYKDARVDMRIMDQVFGPGNWQRSHEVINGNLFCNIDVWDAEKQTWVRKQDVGVESNTEKEKGQASDAFKRAGFNWGVGRELYTSPFIYVELAEGEYYAGQGQQGRKDVIRCYPSTRFNVTSVAYNDRREISGLTIVDRTGAVRFDMSGKGAQMPQGGRKTALPSGTKPQSQAKAPQATQNQPQVGQEQPAGGAGHCPECGGPISGSERGYSRNKFGREMCRACQKAVRSQ